MNSICLCVGRQAEHTSLFSRSVTYCNGANTQVFPLTGEVIFNGVRASSVTSEKTYVKVEGGHITTPVYLPGVVDGLIKAVYRKPAAHLVVAFSDTYTRELYMDAVVRHAMDARRKTGTPQAVIHHIDANKKHNSLHNLIPLSPTEHSAVHASLRRGATPSEALRQVLGDDFMQDTFGDYFTHDPADVDAVVSMLDAAHLPADCSAVIASTPGGAKVIGLAGLNIWQLLSALCEAGATGIKEFYRRKPIRTVK